MSRMKALLIISIVLIQLSFTLSSEGDRSPFYQKCVNNCVKTSCNKDNGFEISIVHELDLWTQLLWNCRDNCRYKCMWRTVQGFQERGYEVPKFHGKWPFTRVFGVQEPGSALASFLNLASHLYMLKELNWRFPPGSVPFVRFWYMFAGVCVNAWIWSTVFHTRDTPFTEFMDYACALSMVMALFVAAIVRVFYRRKIMIFLIMSLTLLYYVQHVKYLWSGVGSAIDYGYNMQVNIIFGALGSVIWLAWALLQLSGGSAAHAWRLAAFTLGSAATLALELLDFPPVAQAWDAHAIWHLSTAPLPLLFYRFVIEDLYYMYPAERIILKNDFHKLT